MGRTVTDDEKPVHRTLPSGQGDGGGGRVGPHQEYRRQAAEHFNRATPTAAQPPPAIFRSPRPAPSAGVQSQLPRIYGSAPTADPAVTAPPAESQAQTSPIAVPRPVRPPFTGSTPPPPRPAPAPPPRPAPPPPRSQVDPAPWQAPSQPTAPAARTGRDLRPEHVLWALTVLSALASFVSGFGWILVVGVCAYFAWVARTRPILWPPDIEELLVHYRLAQPTGRTIPPPKTAVAPAQVMPYIPFRPLTFGEMFGAAYKIVTRNATTLVGIPLVILGTFMFAMSVVAVVAMGLMTTMLLSATLASLGNALMVVFVVFWLLPLVVAFPADALLIALSVDATDKAVRGQRVRLMEVFTTARKRMFAVCRLTGAYYAWFIITDIVVFGMLYVALTSVGTAALLLEIPIFIGIAGVGLMFSLSPIILVVEGRGVVDSFRRAWAMAKMSWQRLVGIQLLWMVCVFPLLLIPGVIIALTLGFLGIMIFYTVVFAALIAYFRTLQMLIYTDLRIRQERYDVELSAAWTHNTGAAS